jgi:predicted O-linked N-acetylglucosamine transferase (SPINDLY family)
LAEYQRVDIGLDTFPYSGGLTTCEALWMGVPVVTWPGETFAGRHSLSHLSNVGLAETVAPSELEFVDCAARLAKDLALLADIRRKLRQQMAGSPLCDAARFAGNWARQMRAIWRVACAER